MKNIFISLFIAFGITSILGSCAQNKVDLADVTIVYDASDDKLVAQMAVTLADDIERVSGVRPGVSTDPVEGPSVVLGTVGKSSLDSPKNELDGKRESFAI
jgi:hypothetical protein